MSDIKAPPKPGATRERDEDGRFTDKNAASKKPDSSQSAKKAGEHRAQSGAPKTR